MNKKGQTLNKPLYIKRLLPNYDIFDEKKYFSKGNQVKILELNGLNIALMICEDMWYSSIHTVDPTDDLKDYIDKNKIKLDLIVNLSAGPFNLRMIEKRIERSKEISNYLQAPFIYVNRVGGEDEVLFDGRSFAVNGNKKLFQGKLYQEDQLTFTIPKYKKSDYSSTSSSEYISQNSINTWESLFSPALTKTFPPQIPILNDAECEVIIESLKFSIREYANKSGMNNFIVACSGGIDSALVLALTSLARKGDEKLEALYMPGHYSATKSYDLSKELCDNLKLKLKLFPIKFFHSSIRNGFNDSFNEEMVGLADENIQSRLRGSLLFARANQTSAMVLNTSNKSEIAVGYSTLYGDSVGALSLLGDLYKTEIVMLCNYINRKYNNIIPAGIITRAPSAELRNNQKDTDSLPAYDILDPILEGILSYRLNKDDLINELGFEKEDVDKVFKLFIRSEFKRFQFCPIVKIKTKSFGFGYRNPICKTF